MSDPYTADGATLQGSYEHVRRAIEFNGQPFAGWLELTGGGVQREGQNYVFGAGDQPRGVTDGRAVPQDITCKMELYTWQALKSALIGEGLSNGDSSETNYQKVSWQIVDQYRGASPTQPTLTRTYTVKVKGDAPDTPNDGNQFYAELTLVQTGIPQETFST